MVKHRTKIGFVDIIVCLVIAVMAFGSLFIMSDNGGDTVEIITEDKTLVLDLRKDTTKTIISNGYELTIEIKNNSVRILESSCPDKYCEKSGWTDDAFRPIVCAPAEVIVRINSTKGGDTDADFIAGRH